MRRVTIARLLLLVPPALFGVSAQVFAADTLVVQWNDVLLQSIRLSRLGPPMVARAIGIVHTCGFDAWAAYDDVAVGTRLGGSLRRPAAERTPANKEKAFSNGEYRCLLDLFPAQTGYIRSQMTAFGFDPDDPSTDTTTPQGIGNVVAHAVLDFRHHDGANQLGDLHPGAYSDYTGYQPVNDPDHINDPNRWQPIRFSDGAGGFITPGYIAPHWGNVIPFALTETSHFRPGPPERWPHGRYVAQAEEILRLNAQLDDEQKVIVEYWADGPRSELPPGHWTLFAEFVSRRDGHTFDQDVQLFFELGNAVFDAGIAVWECKRFYDSERPITAIHFLKAGKKILATVPFQGKQVINGEDWLPYQPPTFITPPFPEYISGHSAFSAASAEILKRFTGSDEFGASVTVPAGSSRVEPGLTPPTDVTLSWVSFSEAADQAGLSRRLGGIHFEEGDLRARFLGRQVGKAVWEKAQSYVNGTAP
ncbi:MAG TPA: vanadium-dependent haloperoxidase [Thermoanaerobaculia bacterium]